MKRALVLQHMNHDHPGVFSDCFAEDGIIPQFVRLFEGQQISRTADYDLLFVLGGAQDTWEEDKHPWLVEEKEFIRDWVATRAKPYIGICLGHQLLANALGGNVELAKTGEVGVFEVKLTDKGCDHGFFEGLQQKQKVMQWHFAEVSNAPRQATVLANSMLSEVQAMAIDRHALSTQFHCEFTPQTVAGWSSLPNYVQSLENQHGPGAYTALLRESYAMLPEMGRMTRRIWNNFKVQSGLIR